MSAHESLAALARDLVEEISAGRALELAAAFAPGAPPVQPGPPPPPPAPTGAAAVHPGLGSYMSSLPGDTISGLAYQHLSPDPAAPGTLPAAPRPGGPPIAGQ